MAVPTVNPPSPAKGQNTVFIRGYTNGESHSFVHGNGMYKLTYQLNIITWHNHMILIHPLRIVQRNRLI